MIMCTAHLDLCLWSDSFPLLMSEASEDSNNLVVPPLNKLVPGFVLVNVLYGAGIPLENTSTIAPLMPVNKGRGTNDRRRT